MTKNPRWGARTAPEVGDALAGGAVVILPIGATEQHGPHLASGADSLFAEEVALAAARRTDDLVLPTLAYGCSLGHTEEWPSTISLSPSTLLTLVLEIGRWAFASGARRLLMLNGHATNGPPCESALLQLRYEIPELRLKFISLFDLSDEISASYERDASDFHANEAETSLMLHLAADLVSMEDAVDEPDRTEGLVLQYPMPAVSSSGVVGTPSQASADGGRRLFEKLVDALTGLLVQVRAETDPVF